MYLKNLNLQDFRSFPEQTFSFTAGVNLILGPNTSGKTNILEAIYLLATGRSFRAEVEREMIEYNQEITRIGAEVGMKDAGQSLRSAAQFSAESNRSLKEKNHIEKLAKDSSKIVGLPATDEEIKLEIVLTAGQVAGQLAPHKKYLVNGVGKRMIDFVGNLRAVLFWPEDLELITNSPSMRRKYLDLVLTQIDREYRRCLLSYEKGIRQRNRLLEKIRDEGTPRTQLLFWNQLLIKNGTVITDKRREFVDFLNQYQLAGLDYQVDYDKSVISESRLTQYAQEEIGAGVTLVGPHRDDFVVKLKTQNSKLKTDEGGRELSLYGSRGEQRLAILWLKLAELEFVSLKTGDPSTGSGQGRPVLLLDDIFSELDHQHRELVLNVIPRQQTIMTTTDLHLIEKNYLKEVKVIELG